MPERKDTGRVMLRRLSALFFFLLLLPCQASAEEASLEITFLNSGYADAIFISAPGKNILLDSGDVTKPALVAEFLKTKGVTSLDLVILSHPHKNHFGALFQVLEEIKIKEIVWNGDKNQEEPFSKLLEKIREKKIPLRAVKADDRLTLSETLSFTVFHPDGEMSENINHNALVLKMDYGKTAALFTTDVGIAGQNKLIQKYGEKLSASLVQIPHHGGPISDEFIAFFKPEFFALSTGPNDWLLPHEEDVALLRAPVYRTDKHGNLIFQSDGEKIWQVSNQNQ